MTATAIEKGGYQREKACNQAQQEQDRSDNQPE